MDKQKKYKLIPIKWIGCPIIETDSSTNECGDVGHMIGNYRIIGYTGDMTGVDLVEYVENNLYDKQPCNHHGNLPYAIGRLEIPPEELEETPEED